jgi:hypothetical protein
MDEKIAAAERGLRVAETAYAAARKAAYADSASRIGALLKQPPSQIAASIEKSVQAATVAYYPFETTTPIPDDQLPKSRARGKVAPAELVSPFRKRGFGVAPPAAGDKQAAEQARAFARRLPNSMIRENLLFSPSGLPDGEPAVLEEANIRPGGPKGNAFYFTDTNRGFLGKSVGFYDRTQPFSFDLWVYAGAEYENSQVITHRDDDNSGGAGYRLSLEKNHLSFYMMHSRPANMLHVITLQQVPVKQWTHVSMTYDGSSRASGISLYVNGQLAAVDIEHDHLTQSSLPRSFAPAFNEFVGVEFGRRFREITLKDGAIDEIRFFNRGLTPIEVAFLHTGTPALEVNSTILQSELTELEVAGNPKVVESGKALYQAREAENQAVSWVPEVMVMADAPKPRQTYLLSRGLYNVQLDPLDPGPLTQIFPLDPSLPKNRIGLTKWLFDPKNPLVARVFVNRMWQQMLGKGIVETSEDFGMQGSRPTHPELLDWLAVDFVQSGWDVKRLMKMIAMSATFRQSSNVSEVLLKMDPDNRLYARGPRLRMSAEQIRDNALAVSGLLVKTIGGPSAHPYQPDGVWVPGVTQYVYPQPNEIASDEQHRRSLYTFVKRNTPPPSMTVFDFSERHQTVARRLTSNTPLQALVLLDDPQYLEAYRVLATRVLKEKTTKEEQIQLVFRLATRRSPSSIEMNELSKYYGAQLALFDKDHKKAEDLVKVGVTPVDSSVDIVQMAALSDVVAAVMNIPDAYSIY